MNWFKSFFRILHIQFILCRYDMTDLLITSFWLRWLVYLNPYHWLMRSVPRGERVRLTIEALGPIFVKAGQMLSTRRDILPDDIACALARLQDQVTPFSGKRAKRMVKNALQKPVREVFTTFDSTPLASASIAQVHAAVLSTGESVVVKILRPNIHQQVETDVRLLKNLTKFITFFMRKMRHFKPQAMINEIAVTLTNELDLLREAANASQLKRNFEKDPILNVPQIYWEYSTSDVLVMERIHGISILNKSALKKAGFKLEKVAEALMTVFFTQVFRDNFFHADLHPGNLSVQHDCAQSPKLIAVDFGIMGSLSSNDQRYIAENMMAFFKRDYQRVAELHIRSGWLPANTRVDQFESAIRAVSEPIFAQSFADISFGNLLIRLFQVAHDYQINIQPQLILLQKTLLGMEGLCRELAPHLNLWETATPQVEKWLKQQVGMRAFLKRIKENIPVWSEQLPQLPSLIFEVLNKFKN